MENLLSKLWTWLSSLPMFLRAFVLVLLAALVLIASMSMSSCGQTVKVTVRDTPTGVSISTTQTKKDSSGTNIHISPVVSLQ